jgi:hypothetical protein
MNSQLNYLIAQQRIAEFACRAEQARLASQARAARSASTRCYVGFLLAPRRLKAARMAAAGQQTNLACAEQCLRCEP